MRIGPYEIEGELGRGAFGVVFRARQDGIARPVAVKVLSTSRAASGNARERFRREARLLAKVHHPGVVAVHDAGEADGLLWYAMDLVAGEALDEVLVRNGPFAPERACEIVRDVALAIGALHGHTILHRDLKPANVLLDAAGRPLVADFGLALDLSSTDERLTRSGASVGTPSFMSPEQLAGGELDARADLYALGGLLYTLLTGHEPHSDA